MRPILLSSSSNARRHLLAQFKQPFRVFAPDIDESPLPGESPIDLVCRLSLQKAQAGEKHCPEGIIIGSDQVGALDGQMLTKPENPEHAYQLLLSYSKRSVPFYTGICVYVPKTHFCKVEYVITHLHFRSISPAQARAYLENEDASACAGGLRLEGLGIALIEAIESSDPTAIIGLPLITVTRLFEEAGCPLL